MQCPCSSKIFTLYETQPGGCNKSGVGLRLLFHVGLVHVWYVLDASLPRTSGRNRLPRLLPLNEGKLAKAIPVRRNSLRPWPFWLQPRVSQAYSSCWCSWLMFTVPTWWLWPVLSLVQVEHPEWVDLGSNTGVHRLPSQMLDFSWVRNIRNDLLGVCWLSFTKCCRTRSEEVSTVEEWLETSRQPWSNTVEYREPPNYTMVELVLSCHFILLEIGRTGRTTLISFPSSFILYRTAILL